jgi:PPOX class probable F420-dependent enzyme
VPTLPAVDRVPPSHADLLDRPLSAALTTHLANGRLQSTVVWFWRDGDDVMLSTMAEFYKARNLTARPLATLMALEPDPAGRWIEVRGTVTREHPDTADGRAAALADLDALSVRYCGVAPYFGKVVSADLAATETPVTFRLRPTAVVVGPVPPRRPSAPVIAPDGTAPPDDAAPPVPDDVPLPPSHQDLFDRPLLAALSTRMPDGSAQTQPVWCGRDRDVVVLSTTLERRKGRNLRADPRATVLVVDPADSSRWVEVRGDVALVPDGAFEVLDALTRAYTSKPAYYGHVAPVEHAGAETRVVVRLHPRRVNCDAIHR